MWISSIVILLGAQLNSEIEHQTARDSTVDGPRPLGVRGAIMADTVGKAHSERHASPTAGSITGGPIRSGPQ
jgi:membrane protein